MSEEEAVPALTMVGETKFSEFDATEAREAKEWIDSGIEEVVKNPTSDFSQHFPRRKLFLIAVQNLLFHKRDLVDRDWYRKVLPPLLSLLREVSSASSATRIYLIEILKTLESVVYNQTEPNSGFFSVVINDVMLMLEKIASKRGDGPREAPGGCATGGKHDNNSEEEGCEVTHPQMFMMIAVNLELAMRVLEKVEASSSEGLSEEAAQLVASCLRTLQIMLLEVTTSSSSASKICTKLSAMSRSATNSMGGNTDDSTADQLARPMIVNACKTAGKVRLYSILAIQGLARMQPKIFHPLWPMLLPHAGSRQSSLLSAVALDPSPRTRMAAAVTIHALFQRSKVFMAAAEEHRATSFTSLSQSLAMTITSMHTGLCSAVMSETHLGAAQHIVKALTALITHAPYKRLKRGYLSLGARAMLSVLNCEDKERRQDVSLRTACMNCLATILENQISISELKESSADWESRGSTSKIKERSRQQQQQQQAQGRSDSSELKRIIDDLVDVIRGITGDANPVKIEAIRALAGVLRNDNDILTAEWRRLEDIVTCQLAAAPPPIRTHIAKLVEFFVGAGEDHEEEELEETLQSPQSTRNVKSKDDERIVVKSLPDDIWNKIIVDILSTMFKDTVAAVRASAMNAVAFLPVEHKGFLRCLQEVWLSARPGDANDSASRGAALKTLGILSQVTPFREDVNFLIKASDVLEKCSHDSTLAVRIKACFSLANICERAFIIQQLATSIRVYGARALGYVASCSNFYELVRGATSSEAASNLSSRIEAAICGMVKSTDYSVKVRWNACHAAKLILQSSIANHMSERTLIHALKAAALEGKNFKVRIQATRALRESAESRLYGDEQQRMELWRELVLSVEERLDLDDPSQYKYKDALKQEQRTCLVILTPLLLRGSAAEPSGALQESMCMKKERHDRSVSWEEGRVVFHTLHAVQGGSRQLVEACRQAAASVVGLLPKRSRVEEEEVEEHVEILCGLQKYLDEEERDKESESERRFLTLQ
ncbi:hypothetical protein GUITHDRAFT_104726 [Guillardia theta CCMP2712]|uniref:DUF4042 domain-containing protein n=1 Tax=Guillardia theta (strain CCMP2712) TaxID=905079 RepID=L1JMD7_GUITC|nr:hypothetical protein GUITHDRAFT_104726 [Guillardia theta CCMP2712]EKX49761.1 hypothetical protein GUITHDRAFT_104726 [Guillardia theta CCMP2712]|eukprot:XP_005836741.1 hypothetical protein GUITHDRAFT_104726 [Guillardia theta CCMP2712]